SPRSIPNRHGALKSVARAAIPTTASRGEVDAGEQRCERRAVDRDLTRPGWDRRELEGAALEALRQDAPARTGEPQYLRQPAPAIHEEVEVAVDRVEPEAPHGTRQRVERAAHVQRFGCEEHAH